MARTAITVDALTESTSATPTSTTIDATNSHVIPATAQVGETVLRINNTTASTKIVTIKAGANPPAVAAGLGDLAISLAQNVTGVVTLDTARFLQADGTVNVDVAASMTGTIEAYQLPQGH